MAVFPSRQLVLPDRVSFVDYLEATGTQYIDTGVAADQDTAFEIEFMTNSALSTSNYGTIFGCINSGTNRFGVGTYPDKSGGQFCRGGAIYNPYITVGSKITLSLADGVFHTPNGDESVGTATFSVGANIAVFARKWANGKVDEYSRTQLFAFKLYKNGTLIRDYRPCLDADGVACLYDKVAGACVYNAGTGDFIAG